MRRHLPAAGRRIVRGANRLQEHVVRRHAQHQHQRAIAIVGEKPVVAGLQQQTRRGENSLVPRTADLKEDLVLPLELDFAVVEPPREEHRAVDAYKRIAVEAVVLRSVKSSCLDLDLRGHRVCLRRKDGPLVSPSAHYSQITCRTTIRSRPDVPSQTSNLAPANRPFGQSAESVPPRPFSVGHDFLP